jgi:hypothetical protein
MAELQRKIELQSIEDLQFLVGNIRRGANEKIDQALPTIEGEGEDAMRKRVEEDVHDVRILPHKPHRDILFWTSR